MRKYLFDVPLRRQFNLSTGGTAGSALGFVPPANFMKIKNKLKLIWQILRRGDDAVLDTIVAKLVADEVRQSHRDRWFSEARRAEFARESDAPNFGEVPAAHWQHGLNWGRQ
jgi:hypothetical protein